MNFAFAVIHEKNGVFGISWPDFPGLITGADTIEQAAQKADEALAFHIAGMVEDSDAIPSPRSRNNLFADSEAAEWIKDGILLLTRFDLPKRVLGNGGQA